MKMSNTKEMMRRVTELDGLENALNLLDMALSVYNETKEPKICAVTGVIHSGRGSFTIAIDNDDGDEVDLQVLYLFLHSGVENKINYVNTQLNQILEERLNSLDRQCIKDDKEKND